METTFLPPDYISWREHYNLVEEAKREERGRLRAKFLRLLTVDSKTQDARRKEFNQAIFNAEKGWAVFNGTDLSMVMGKFDKALKEKIRDATVSNLIELFSRLFPKYKTIIVLHEDSAVSIITSKTWHKGSSETGIVKLNVRTGQVDIGI